MLDEDTIEKETGLSLKRYWRFTYQKEEPFCGRYGVRTERNISERRRCCWRFEGLGLSRADEAIHEPCSLAPEKGCSLGA